VLFLVNSVGGVQFQIVFDFIFSVVLQVNGHLDIAFEAWILTKIE